MLPPPARAPPCLSSTRAKRAVYSLSAALFVRFGAKSRLLAWSEWGTHVPLLALDLVIQSAPIPQAESKVPGWVDSVLLDMENMAILDSSVSWDIAIDLETRTDMCLVHLRQWPTTGVSDTSESGNPAPPEVPTGPVETGELRWWSQKALAVYQSLHTWTGSVIMDTQSCHQGMVALRYPTTLYGVYEPPAIAWEGRDSSRDAKNACAEGEEDKQERPVEHLEPRYLEAFLSNLLLCLCEHRTSSVFAVCSTITRKEGRTRLMATPVFMHTRDRFANSIFLATDLCPLSGIRVLLKGNEGPPPAPSTKEAALVVVSLHRLLQQKLTERVPELASSIRVGRPAVRVSFPRSTANGSVPVQLRRVPVADMLELVDSMDDSGLEPVADAVQAALREVEGLGRLGTPTGDDDKVNTVALTFWFEPCLGWLWVDLCVLGLTHPAEHSAVKNRGRQVPQGCVHTDEFVDRVLLEVGRRLQFRGSGEPRPSLVQMASIDIRKRLHEYVEVRDTKNVYVGSMVDGDWLPSDRLEPVTTDVLNVLQGCGWYDCPLIAIAADTDNVPGSASFQLVLRQVHRIKPSPPTVVISHDEAVNG
jgi:hypothetical protein